MIIFNILRKNLPPLKKLFYLGTIGLILFEIATVFFIMPIPGSQEMNSLDLAYFLYSWRWVFRLLFGSMILLGVMPAFRSSRWWAIAGLLIVAGITYLLNFKMTAETMFYQPTSLQLLGTANNNVDTDRLVIGIAHNGEAKAYPIQYIGYHHQVRDSIGGQPVMVTYCTVCRTGRVFEPIVNGKTETFRLVGMDHYNAMFEDETTGSWWRQATGEAVAGKLQGQMLPEFPSTQTTLKQWVALHPNTLVMQADDQFQEDYDDLDPYEMGKLTGRLLRRDTASWQPKSWVIGLKRGLESKAYDWNRLQAERIIHDQVDGQPIVIVLAKDNQSFFVLEREHGQQKFQLRNDTLISDGHRYSLLGKACSEGMPDLKKLTAYQEYWHSWQAFHPETTW